MADAAVEDLIAHADNEPADERRLHVHFHADPLARAGFESLAEGLRLVETKSFCGADMGFHDAEALVFQRAVRSDDGWKEFLPCLLDEQSDEPHRQIIHLALEEAFEHRW